jgi:hypothetical protein
MPLPRPVPGLVVRYGYLWAGEHLEGREEGRKDRPCAIIAAVRTEDVEGIRVLVLPITHRPPEDARFAIEIPAIVKRRLRLDGAQSWVVISEWNDFVWPGPDLRRLPDADESTVAYGMLPPKLFAIVRDRFLTLANAGAAVRVRRT